MWCKWRKEMGNEQPETQAQVSPSPCACGPVSWYRSILFSKQKPKTAKIQHSAHRSAVRDAYNHHPFLKRDFLCKKWLSYGNALNPCNHANPFPLLWRRCQYCNWGHFWWYQQKQLNKSKAVLLVLDIHLDRHSHCPGTATFIFHGKKILRHKAVADARIQVLYSSSSFMALPPAHAAFALG